MHDPQLVPFFVFGTLLVTAFAVAVIVSLIIQKQRQVKARLERQRLEFHYTQMLLNTKIEVQESTLTMLSQELHDNVNQVLTAGVMQLSSAGSYIQDEKGRTIIESAKQTVKSAIKDIRLLSHSLNTGMVEHRDTAEAIRDELTRIEAFSEITCSLHAEEEHDLPPEQRLLLFRIVQEALQNILKHAQARHITVTISSTPEQYSMTIADDGKGFDVTDARIADSMGMRNMRERVTLMQGQLRITSSPGNGTTLDLSIPIAEQNGQDTHSNSR